MAPLIAYAARTGTARNLDALRSRGWRLLVSATGAHRTESFDHFAIDNGAWTAYQRFNKGLSPTPILDKRLFTRLVLMLGGSADWAVACDIVMGGLASLALSLRWIPWVLKHCKRALLAVQDGMTVEQIRPHLGVDVGVFVGGSDVFKETTVRDWAELARERGTICHVGRVNSQRRIHLCAAAGVTSFDGSGVSRYALEIPAIHRAVVQQSLLVDRPRK